jgi:uncharacterized membrane protein
MLMVDNNSKNQNKTVLGLEENIEGLLCYVLTWFSGLIILFIEKDNKFVKFHAIQSLVTFLILQVASYVFRAFPIIGWLFSGLIWLLQFGLWILLIYKAYNRELFKLPIIGDIAEKQAFK